MSKPAGLQIAVTNKAASLTDDQILELMRQERTFERGFRALMSQYQERLYWHIRRLVLRHDDADDVLQNTLVKVYRGIGQFEGKSKLYTWLYRIATNESITFLQQAARNASVPMDDPGNMLSQHLQADEWFDGDEAQRKLQMAIAQLPDKQRLVFNLRYYQEMPYEEMSALLDTSVGALKASFHHAVKKLEALLGR